MQSVDVANSFITRHGQSIALTNLSLNKLVYFAQVESLKTGTCVPIFSDIIEAWDYGPVEPAVYQAFKQYGDKRILSPSSSLAVSGSEKVRLEHIVDQVANSYGKLTAFDLVRLSHREGGAWRSVYAPGSNNEITIKVIKDSRDYREMLDYSRTLAAGIQNVEDRWPNALRMLEDA